MKDYEKNEKDYKEEAWKQYTPEELSQWVSLLSKRATHRANKKKAAKDIADAKSYLEMLGEKLEYPHPR